MFNDAEATQPLRVINGGEEQRDQKTFVVLSKTKDQEALVEQVFEAMRNVNERYGPTFFFKDEQLVYRRPSVQHFITPSDPAVLGVYLTKYIRYRGTSNHALPNPILRTILADPDAHGLLPLKASRTIPFVGPATNNYDVVCNPGYFGAAQTWLDVPAQLADLPNELANFTSIPQAVSVIFDDLLFDFRTRWPSRRDQAHYLAVLIEPYVRPLIQGPTPLNFFSANDPGSGKSLLARFHGAIAFGVKEKLTMTPWTLQEKDDYELDRTFPGVAQRNLPYVYLDNIKGRLSSPKLAAMLTEGTHTCKVVYKAANLVHDITWQWIATGNSPDFDRDIGRRILNVNVRAQPKSERPETYRWTVSTIAQNRSRFMAALLYIAREGLRIGTMHKAPFFDSYDAYTKIMWPIMVNAGFSEFDPASNIEQDASDSGTQNEACMRALYAYQTAANTPWLYAREIWSKVMQPKSLALPGFVPDTTDERTILRLGKTLAKTPETLGAYKLERRRGRDGAQYRSVLVGEDPLLAT